MSDIISQNATPNNRNDFQSKFATLLRQARLVSFERLTAHLVAHVTVRTDKRRLYDIIDRSKYCVAAEATIFLACQTYVAEKKKELRAAHENFNPSHYVAYQMLIGGTPNWQSPKLDFPDPYSLGSFLTRVIEGKEKALLPKALLLSESPCLKMVFGDAKILSDLMINVPETPEKLRARVRKARIPLSSVNGIHP